MSSCTSGKIYPVDVGFDSLVRRCQEGIKQYHSTGDIIIVSLAGCLAEERLEGVTFSWGRLSAFEF